MDNGISQQLFFLFFSNSFFSDVPSPSSICSFCKKTFDSPFLIYPNQQFNYSSSLCIKLCDFVSVKISKVLQGRATLAFLYFLENPHFFHEKTQGFLS